MKIKISACTIVKNEAKNIERWLGGVRSFADEIIITDTGSTDNTVALAKAGGAAVKYFPWCNDFAAAKNFAIEQAHGDWIVMLDADEYFDETSQKKIRQVIGKFHKQKQVAGLITPFLNIDVNHDNKILSQAWQMRIFRREQNLRFVGRVHETLLNVNAQGDKREFVVAEDLQFIHTGYSIDNMEEKYQRNLQILQAEIKKQGEVTPRQFAYLQDCYMGIKDYHNAIRYGKLALEHHAESGLVGNERKAVCQLLDAIWQVNRKDYARELEAALAQFPNFAELWVLRGRLLLGQKNIVEAEQAFKEALRLRDKKVTSIEEISNTAIESMLPEIEASLAYIDRYKPYYEAMARQDYESAACAAVQMLRNLRCQLHAQ